MKIAIVGLPNCGKTTLFNALTGGQAETARYSSGRLSSNLGVVKVPDARLQPLAQLYQPRKVTPAEVEYVDLAGIGGPEQRGSELPAELLNYLGGAEALLEVVRAFGDASVPHPAGEVDPARDLANFELELMLRDLGIVERRLEKIERDAHKFSVQERREMTAEREVLEKLRRALEAETPLRDLQLEPEEEKRLRGYQFLTAKPLLLVPNIGEEDLERPWVPEYPHQNSQVVPVCARMEEELAQLEEPEAAEFRREFGVEKPARERLIEASYALLGLISFLTVGPDEVRAWTIRSGTRAVEAARVIHSDIERGFIRAEVIAFPDLMETGGMSQARKAGKLRLEGRDYRVQDGDICHFLFNV